MAVTWPVLMAGSNGRSREGPGIHPSVLLKKKEKRIEQNDKNPYGGKNAKVKITKKRPQKRDGLAF